jgi:hypothetical protein
MELITTVKGVTLQTQEKIVNVWLFAIFNACTESTKSQEMSIGLVQLKAGAAAPGNSF